MTIDFSGNRDIRAGSRNFWFRGEELTLAGSHTWDTVIPFGGVASGIRRLVGNFHRLWSHIETPRVTLDPPGKNGG